MRRVAIALLSLVALGGCVAAVPLYMAASYGLTAFSLYSVYSVGNVKDASYEVQKQELTVAGLRTFQDANTVAVYPTNSGVDGAVVDIFSERSGLETISSRTTIAYVERTGTTQDRILSYPAKDQAEEIQKFGQAVGADLVVFALITDARVKTSAFLSAVSGSELTVTVKIYDTSSSALVLDELHQIKVDVGDAPTNMELAQLAALGISDRINELRSM